MRTSRRHKLKINEAITIYKVTACLPLIKLCAIYRNSHRDFATLNVRTILSTNTSDRVYGASFVLIMLWLHAKYNYFEINFK